SFRNRFLLWAPGRAALISSPSPTRKTAGCSWVVAATPISSRKASSSALVLMDEVLPCFAAPVQAPWVSFLSTKYTKYTKRAEQPEPPRLSIDRPKAGPVVALGLRKP